MKCPSCAEAELVHDTRDMPSVIASIPLRHNRSYVVGELRDNYETSPNQFYPQDKEGGGQLSNCQTLRAFCSLMYRLTVSTLCSTS